MKRTKKKCCGKASRPLSILFPPEPTKAWRTHAEEVRVLSAKWRKREEFEKWKIPSSHTSVITGWRVRENLIWISNELDSSKIFWFRFLKIDASRSFLRVKDVRESQRAGRNLIFKSAPARTRDFCWALPASFLFYFSHSQFSFRLFFSTPDRSLCCGQWTRVNSGREKEISFLFPKKKA